MIGKKKFTCFVSIKFLNILLNRLEVGITHYTHFASYCSKMSVRLNDYANWNHEILQANNDYLKREPLLFESFHAFINGIFAVIFFVDKGGVG